MNNRDLAKEFDPKKYLSTHLTGASGPYEPTAAMLAKELRPRRPSVFDHDAERALSPYLPSRAMLAKEEQAASSESQEVPDVNTKERARAE